MSNVSYVKTENGTVVNSAMIDTGKVPKWATTANGWTPDNGREVGMVDDGAGNFAHPDETEAEKTAKVDVLMREYTNELSPLKHLTDIVFEQGRGKGMNRTRDEFDADLRRRVEGG